MDIRITSEKQNILETSVRHTDVNCLLIGDSGVGKTSLVVSYTTNDYPSSHNPSTLDTYCVEVFADNRPVRLKLCDAGGTKELSSLRHLSYPGSHVILLCFSVVRPTSFRSLRNEWLTELSGAQLVLNPYAQRLASALLIPKGQAVNGNIRLDRNNLKTHHGSFKGKPRSSCKQSNNLAHDVEARQRDGPVGPAFLLVGCACDLRNDIGELLKLSKSGEEPVDKTTAEQLAAELGAKAYVECSALTQKNLKTVFDLAVWCGLEVADSNGSVFPKTVNGDCLGKTDRTVPDGQPTTNPTISSNFPSHGTSHITRTDDDLNEPYRNLWRRFFCLI